MSLHATCPGCGLEADIEAFFADGDGKRLAARFAELEPALGRAALGYLRLFKPPKTSLRLARAARLIDELVELVSDDTVCKDERTGLRRPANSALWTAGIEQMLGSRDRLSLPLDGHGYLRAVVFGLADQAQARAETKREEDRRAGRHRTNSAGPRQEDDPIKAAIKFADQMLGLGSFTREQRDDYITQAKAKYGGSHE